MKSLLELRAVHFSHAHAGAEVVRGVSLQVAPGEVVGVIGPNAAGKSTLARIACGLLAPKSGEVLLSGDPIAQLPRRERARRVSFLPQETPHELAFTAREVALMGRAPHLGLWALEGPNDHARAEAALRETDTLELAERPVAKLSGGERQRVFLARAFAQEAALFVLDEPTAGLDLGHQVLLVNALRKRARSGFGALLVLHDLALAGAACDRLILVVAGSVQSQGAPAEVLRPELLEAAYGTAVDVVQDPKTGQPLVAPRIER